MFHHSLLPAERNDALSSSPHDNPVAQAAAKQKHLPAANRMCCGRWPPPAHTVCRPASEYPGEEGGGSMRRISVSRQPERV